MLSLQNFSQCVSIYVVSVNLGSMKYIENISIFKEISLHSHKEPIGNVTFYVENIFLIKIWYIKESFSMGSPLLSVLGNIYIENFEVFAERIQ